MERYPDELTLNLSINRKRSCTLGYPVFNLVTQSNLRQLFEADIRPDPNPAGRIFCSPAANLTFFCKFVHSWITPNYLSLRSTLQFCDTRPDNRAFFPSPGSSV